MFEFMGITSPRYYLKKKEKRKKENPFYTLVHPLGANMKKKMMKRFTDLEKRDENGIPYCVCALLRTKSSHHNVMSSPVLFYDGLGQLQK